MSFNYFRAEGEGNHNTIVNHYQSFLEAADRLSHEAEEREEPIIDWKNIRSIYSYNQDDIMNGNEPDYNDENTQIKYCLRYDFAYIFEYHMMYSHVIEKLEENQEREQKKISVLSLGCGAGQDAYGLLLEMQLRGYLTEESGWNIYYTGVDCADWRSTRMELNAPHIKNLHYVYYVQDNFLNYFRNMRQNEAIWRNFWQNINVIMFPKSLCENPNDIAELVGYICDGIRTVGTSPFILISFPRPSNNFHNFTPMGYDDLKRGIENHQMHICMEWRWGANSAEEQNRGIDRWRNELNPLDYSSLETSEMEKIRQGRARILYESQQQNGLYIVEENGERLRGNNCLPIHLTDQIREKFGIGDQGQGADNNQNRETHMMPLKLTNIVYAGFKINPDVE